MVIKVIKYSAGRVPDYQMSEKSCLKLWQVCVSAQMLVSMRRPTHIAYDLHHGSHHKGIFVTSACALLPPVLADCPIH